MNKEIILSSVVLVFFMTSSLKSIAQNNILFRVSFTEPQAHYADVEMEISNIKKEIIDIKMPVWTPGSYLIREFSKNIEGFEAADATGKKLPTEKTAKNVWRVKAGGAEKISIKYRVYAFEISVRTSFVDASHAFLSPTGIFMYADEFFNQPVNVAIKPYQGWSEISTGLEPVSGKAQTFRAADFDILFDSPIEVGNQDIFEFNAAGVKHEVAMYGGGNYDKERLKTDMAKIVEEETAIFGENPNKRYVFIVHNYSTGGGGLEHLNSTVLGFPRLKYADQTAYRSFLALVAHEYFHLWNVKRLRPAALGPFDYEKENYTTNLWIAEGFTAYYDNLIVQRAEFYSPGKYLEMLAESISSVENQPGNRIQPVSEASFDAWIKQYRPNENSRNTTISYYNKGAVVALVMDLEILHATQGEKGLDDVMKAMYDEYYKKQNRGYTNAEFRAMAEKIAGKPLTKIYDDYVNGTKPVDYATYFGYAGLSIQDQAAQNNEPYLGASASLKEGQLTIVYVARNSPAWDGGLNVNDEIIAVNGNRVSDIDKTIATKTPGDKIEFLISRDNLIKTIDISVAKNPNNKFVIQPKEDATPAQIALRKKWLSLGE